MRSWVLWRWLWRLLSCDIWRRVGWYTEAGGFSETSVITNTSHEARNACLAKYFSERHVFRTSGDKRKVFRGHCKFSQVLRFSWKLNKIGRTSQNCYSVHTFRNLCRIWCSRDYAYEFLSVPPASCWCLAWLTLQSWRWRWCFSKTSVDFQ